jgi:DNA-binding NtrC family response regulator
MILERAGYQVVAIDDPAYALQAFTTSGIDAVVFGESIRGPLQHELARHFKGMNRSVPIIAMSKTSGSFPAGLVDEQLESLGDPQLLLEALRRVLVRAGDSSVTDGHNGAGPDSSTGATTVSENRKSDG